jgi:class 3 adenylate cyclase/tetratricopeptide (TPR) repeat protein
MVAADTQTLASFLPNRLVRRLIEQPASAGAPYADTMVAALMLADISGFTAITDRLARHGPVGVEELRGFLDGVFQPLLRLVTDSGGDVLKFAGDALLTCWPADGFSSGRLGQAADAGERLAAATATAVRCGHAMHAALHRYAAQMGIPLALRIGIGAGDLVVLDVGGERARRDLLIAGDAVPQATGAASRAAPGQVILSESATQLMKHADNPPAAVTDTTEWRPAPSRTVDASALALPDQARDLLLPYLPRAVLAWTVAGHEEWLAELRQVTVVFVNLPDLDHTTGLDEAQLVMQRLQGAIYAYEGSLNKLSLDEKGTTLVAAFGLPPLAHEDDPIRGLQAGLAISEAMTRLDRRAAVGVTSGRVFCGTVGTGWRREYTVLGSAVNLAARLMQQAGDDVLCDAATAQAAESTLAVQPLPAVRVKGRANPLPVYRAVRPATQSRRGQRAPVPGLLIGRDAERRQLTGMLDRLMASNAGTAHQTLTLVVEGEVGVGKSRLVGELQSEANAFGLRVLIAAGDAVEHNTPLHAWRELFGRTPIFGGGDPAACRRAVFDLLGADPDIGDMAPLLNPVLPLAMPETALSAQLSGQGRADKTRDLVVQLLRAFIGDTPTVLIIEDAHWLDSASIGLALALSRERLPLLLVVVTRPPGETGTASNDVGEAAYWRLLVESTAERLVVDRLPLHAVAELVAQRLGTAAAPAALVRLVEDKAEGNPLFTEQLTYAVRDAGLVRMVDGQAELVSDVTAVLAGRLPDTVHGAIISRIDQLSATQQLTIKAASIIGRAFPVTVLRAVHPIGDGGGPTLIPDLAAIERANLANLDTSEPEVRYLFKHVVIQEAAYSLMLISQRRQLHGAVAHWYERNGGDASLLAHHWRLAGVPAKAIHYLQLAGSEALREGAYVEAVRFFTALLELDDARPADPDEHGVSTRAGPVELRRTPPHPAAIQRASWEHQLGDAYRGLGQLEPERQHLHAALALLGRRTPATGGRLVIKLGWQLGQQLRNRVSPRPLLAPPEARAALEEAGELCQRLFIIDYHAGRRARAVHQAVKGLNLAEAAGSRSAEARLAAACSLSAGILGRHRLADAYRRRALTALEDTADDLAQGWVLQGAALYAIGVGRWTEAGQWLDEAAQITRRLGDPRRQAEITGLRAWQRYFRGQLTDVEPLLAELDRLSEHSGDEQVRAWALAGHAILGLRTGNLDEAAQAVSSRPAPAPTAMLAVLRGDRATAVRALRRALRQASRPPVKCYWFDLYAMSSEVATALWLEHRDGKDVEHWQTIAHRAVGYLGHYAAVFPIGRPRALLHHGLHAWIAGRPMRARQDWRRALITAHRLGMRYEQALAHEMLGRYGEPDQRSAHGARSRELLHHMGITEQTFPQALAERLALAYTPETAEPVLGLGSTA